MIHQQLDLEDSDSDSDIERYGWHEEAEECVFIVSSSDHCVKYFDADGMQIGVIGGFKYPQGIASSNDGHIVVADTGNHKIKVLASNERGEDACRGVNLHRANRGGGPTLANRRALTVFIFTYRFTAPTPLPTLRRACHAQTNDTPTQRGSSHRL
jgi:hypothetical protein